MKKRIVALAVAGVLAAPMAAQAGVEVYGQARLSVGMIGDDNSAAGSDDSSLAVTSHASRLGFKGSEDLGNGLKAVYQYERGIDLDNQASSTSTTYNITDSNGDTSSVKVTDSTSNITARNSFVGLAGGFGTLIVGIHDTPYKMATGKLDPFTDTYGDYNAVINSDHDARLDNVVAYISPDMSGFSLAAAYVSDVANDDLPDAASNDDKDAYSISGMYSNGPLYASLAVQSISNFKGVGQDADAMKLGVGYKLGKTDIGFVYENTELKTTPKGDQTSLYLSVVHPVAADTNLKFAYGQLGESGDGNDDGGTLLAVGISKNMTKNAELYALYSQVSNDDNGKAGLKNGGGPVAVQGESATALAVGINLKFSSM